MFCPNQLEGKPMCCQTDKSLQYQTGGKNYLYFIVLLWNGKKCDITYLKLMVVYLR